MTALNPGDTVERYEVVRVIGEGGMAAVIEVRHRDLGTVHAMKLLQVAAPGLHERLLQEGRMQAQVSDPHICRVTDVVRVDGTPALVMELVQGPALDALLASYQPNLLQIDHLGRGILAGVRAAHAAGLVHRDLKPANVLVDVRDGKVVPKVADFGLAKALGDSLEARGGLRTRSGTTMGTPTFMAPEQFRDARFADHRSDLFSVGCVLYELACGIPAFQGDDVVEVYRRTSTGDYRPLREIAPHLPERMVAAIDRALRPDPADRWQDCDAMLRAWAGDVPDTDAAKGWEDTQLELVRSLSPSRQPLRSSATFVGSEGGPAAPEPDTAEGAIPAPTSTPSRSSVLAPRVVMLSVGTGLAVLAASVLLGVIGVGAGLYAWTREEAPPDPEAAPVAAAPDPEPEPEAVVVAPEPAPEAPRPAPRPRPAPAAAPDTGRVAITGVDRAWLVRADGERHKPGAVPPGTYEVVVFFDPSRPTTVMSLAVAAGDDRTVRCDAALKACR